MIFPRTQIVIVVGMLSLGMAAAAWAQAAGGPPNALQGFSQNRDQPVQIDAARLEVRDKNKVATFSGSVKVVQGDTTLRCKTLAVFYDQEGSGSTLAAAKPGPGGQSRIRRLEAKGGVEVTQKDQVATGEIGPVRHGVEYRHAERQCHCETGTECAARRAAGRRSDVRRVARRGRKVRQWPCTGTVSAVERAGEEDCAEFQCRDARASRAKRRKRRRGPVRQAPPDFTKLFTINSMRSATAPRRTPFG